MPPMADLKRDFEHTGDAPATGIGSSSEALHDHLQRPLAGTEGHRGWRDLRDDAGGAQRVQVDVRPGVPSRIRTCDPGFKRL